MGLIDISYLDEHFIWLHLGVHIIVLVQLAEVLDYLFGLVLVGHESFLDAFDVVVGSSAGLSSLQQPLSHHFLPAL